MRILMVNDLAVESGWGAETHVRRLAGALEAAGDDVELFAGEVTHHGLGKALDIWDPFARRALRERAERFLPDVVHHHNVLRELSVSVLGAPAGVPSVMTVHEHRLLGVLDSPPRTPRELLKLPLSALHRRVVRRDIDVLVGVSKHLTRSLEAAGFGPVENLPQFAEPMPSDLASIPVGETSDVVMAGRLAADKGIEILVAAFEAVAGEHAAARLVVAGQGPDEDVVVAAARRLGPDRVCVMGKLDSQGVQSLFGHARVVVAPALPAIRPEGAGTTPIEAALAGRPVIVSDDPGHREFVDESGGGMVVTAGSVAALADALHRLLADAGLAQELGDRGRRFAEERRTTAAIVPAMRAIYERAIARHEARPVHP
jgi:glycosyltransferase involved in cell wall biosynthesis